MFATFTSVICLRSDFSFLRYYFREMNTFGEFCDNQIDESYDTLRNYGNLTGVSIPTVMDKALLQNESILGKGLLIGITMGFGLDLVEVERI